MTVNVAYLMLVHKNPQLLKRAIEMLSCEGCAFFIHVDQKTDIREFSSVGGDNVFFSQQRIPVHWGEFSQVAATVKLIRQILGCSRRYDYLSFSTGSDYPLRSGKYIRTFFEAHRGVEFMNLLKMPAPGYPLSKISTLRYPSDKPVRRFVFRALAKLDLAQRDYRKYLGPLEAYAGDGYWALSREACEYIVTFVQRNPYVERYFRNTFTSDEMFFHTIIGNSPFRSRVRRSLVYVDWSSGPNHPSMLNETHMKCFEEHDKVWIDDQWGSSEVLFARKFSDANLDLLNRIDRMIRRKDESSRLPKVMPPHLQV